MEYLIIIPLKKAYEIDLYKNTKSIISSQYGSVDDKTKENLHALEQMRNDATSKWMNDSPNEGTLEMVQKYYDQIVLLMNKLPHAEIPFKWKDAFEKGGLFSSGAMTVSNIGYEKICLLFNIGALMNNIGAHVGKASNDDHSLKQAIKHFQGAAGIFQALKHTTCSSAQTSELSFDLQSDVLNLLQQIMIAQAQEAFFFKASNDNKKPKLIAKIAAQCEDFYSEVYRQIQTINYSSKTSIPEWIDVFNMKQHAYRVIAEYYQSLEAQSEKNFGEQIARLKKLLEFRKTGESSVSISFTKKFKEIVSKAEIELQQVQRDNDFIYHSKIPDFKTLPTISKAVLAKATDFSELFYPDQEDLFKNLLPFGMQQSIKNLEQQKSELVSVETANLREMTQTLNAVLASLNLPAAIEDIKNVEVPKSVEDSCKMIKENGGIEELNRLFNEFPDLVKRNQEILSDVENSLNSEEQSDNSLKAQYKEKWNRTPSSKINQTFRDNVNKYKNILEIASNSDKSNKNNYETNLDKIKLVCNLSNGSLANIIPPKNSSSIQVDDSVVNPLRQLLSQVDALKREREALENQLKNIDFEEIKVKFMNAMNIHKDVNEPSLSTETIAQFYGELQKKVRESQEKQDKLLEEIRNANETFVAQKGNTGSKRDQFLRDCSVGQSAYMKVLSGLKEGIKFYNELTQVLVNLQVKINDFCFARKAEQEELLKDLQKENASQPNVPHPSVSANIKPEVSRPPPSVPAANFYPAPTPVTSQSGQPPYPVGVPPYFDPYRYGYPPAPYMQPPPNFNPGYDPRMYSNNVYPYYPQPYPPNPGYPSQPPNNP